VGNSTFRTGWFPTTVVDIFVPSVVVAMVTRAALVELYNCMPFIVSEGSQVVSNSLTLAKGKFSFHTLNFFTLKELPEFNRPYIDVNVIAPGETATYSSGCRAEEESEPSILLSVVLGLNPFSWVFKMGLNNRHHSPPSSRRMLNSS